MYIIIVVYSIITRHDISRGYAQSVTYILGMGSGRILPGAGNRPIQSRSSYGMFTDNALITMSNSNSLHDVNIINAAVGRCLDSGEIK